MCFQSGTQKFQPACTWNPIIWRKGLRSHRNVFQSGTHQCQPNCAWKPNIWRKRLRRLQDVFQSGARKYSSRVPTSRVHSKHGYNSQGWKSLNPKPSLWADSASCRTRLWSFQGFGIRCRDFGSRNPESPILFSYGRCLSSIYLKL